MPSTPPPTTPTVRIDLAGTWSRSIAGTEIDLVEVPGSYAPVGTCVLEREVIAGPLPAGQRLFLVTEGVLASARFRLNGQDLGTAAAWSTFRFELPPGCLRSGANRLQAEVQDLTESFGPMPGRRCDGGLVRPLWIEARPTTFLSALQVSPGMSPDCRQADLQVRVELDGPQDRTVALVLTDPDGVEVARGEATAGRSFQAHLDRPRLWSPEHPHLYTLTAVLPGHASECLVEQIGFRRIDVQGHDLFLNTQRLLLKGVCRHEFTHASGYSPCAEEIRRDLARIKHAGFNYVRLVHSPPAGLVCRIAAEIGLLVSEEPGTCWHDLGNDVIAAPAVECLRRTVLRDRNVPSILAWFIYNECNPHVGYAVRIANMVRSIDPGCQVAMADCSGNDAMLTTMAAEAGLSFYGINVYGPNRKALIERMRTLTDRPLVITEWSGFLGQGNDRLLRDLCACFVRHTRVDEPLRLSGGSIWVWADYEEHSRPSPASVDGWTVEGLIQADGRPKNDLLTLSQMCFDMDHPPAQPPARATVVCTAPRRSEPWQPIPLGIPGDAQEVLERRMDQVRQVRDMDNWLTVPQDHDGYAFTPAFPRLGRLLVDGIEFHARDAQQPAVPLLLGRERPRVSIPVGARVTGIAVLGHVMLGGGYPAPPAGLWAGTDIGRPLGAIAAEYHFVYADGSVVVQPLRHGIEILRHNDICRWWTPAPRAAATRPAVRAVIDTRYEILRLDLWQRTLPPGELVEMRWELIDQEALLLLAAVSVLTNRA